MKKRLTILLLAFLFAFAGFGQRVLTYGDKVLTYGDKVLTIVWTPNEIAGLEFWFDGKDPSTVSLNGNKVIQWDDKSGFGRHVANAVDARRPTYDPVTRRLTFNNAAATYLQSAAFGAALVQPNTIFIVYKITGALDDYGIIFDGLTDWLIFYINASKFIIYSGFNVSQINTNANDNIHVGEFNGAASNYWINGINCPLCPVNVGAKSLDGITLGGSHLLDGQWGDIEIMEVFGYNRVLTDEEKTQLTNYLQDKWDLSLWLIILLIPNIRRKDLRIAA